MSKIQCLMSVNALAAGVEDLETSVVLDAVLNEVTKCIEELTERKIFLIILIFGREKGSV